jgi:hypothetical protein
VKDTHSHAAPLSVLALSWVLLGAIGCDSDDSHEPARGPDNLGIHDVERADGAAVVDKSGGSLTIDCTTPLLVAVAPTPASNKLGDFLLAPPGGCTTDNCGWMALSVSSEDAEIANVLSAQSPILVELPEAMRSGRIALRIELRDSNGDPVLTEENEVLAGRFDVLLKPESDCTTVDDDSN